ncbi:hypothetical protein F0L17_15790 [Streptomyces sp. TRM43335]|uniref:Knr4/Smi1-like domain-containing protein n=2 Tax=Streptomyces taklimakanensis TaxID=2569853 RepID=A0A6G2BE37_9ACTN|nr:SMI1/KNR4 family protein [Streptomyces taklimakanensis]MTE20541.1 hypothetical protein [Streptomyces taklimakanensis]
MSMERLAAAAGLNGPRRYVVDWQRVEASLGTRLPADYREYVYWFGPGNFQDEFVVCVPGVENSNVELASRLRDERDSGRLWTEVSGDPVPFPLFPEPAGWLPFAFTLEGGAVYWVTEGEDPDRWTIGARDRMWRPERFDGGFSEFLREAVWDTIELDAVQEYGDEPPLAFRPSDGAWIGGAGARLEPYGSFEEAAEG